ncbi:MAG: hypothetical protein K9J17_00495 [Flavobacteriales bacterium]|nr:hypothetical protein [Flavobacteriales bacterium]
MRTTTLLILVLTIIFCGLRREAKAQYIPYHTDHEDVYNFLSELRVLGVVHYNPAVLPLSRKEIADMLMAADTSAKLNPIQQKELGFWMQEFGKDIGMGKVIPKKKFFKRRMFADRDTKKRLDLFYFANDLFQVTVNPIFSGLGGINTNGDLRLKHWRGGEMFGRIGKGFGFYFSLIDFVEKPNWSSSPNLSPEMGGVYRGSKTTNGAIEYYELRGGITYGWKWGQVGILKDNLELGSAGRNQVILSKRPPSFPRFHLQLKPIKWAELTYTIGWLNSEIVDSSRSYITGNGAYRQVFHQKFFAANLITVRLWKYLSLSFGSSVIIADNNLNIGHFIPLMFYTALDQSFNGQNNSAGQNSQVYADLSWDVFGWGQVYGSILIDEIRLSTMFDSKNQRNSLGYQLGLQTRPFTKWNLKAYGSYTRTRPGVYSHYIPTTTYAHANYGLGNFLGENADQIIVGLQFRPIAKLRVIMEYERWRKGPEHVFGNNASNLTGARFMSQTVASTNRITFKVRYHIINDLSAQLMVNHITGSTDGTYFFPDVSTAKSKSTWVNLTLNVGF